MIEPLMSKREVAAWLGVSVRTVERLISRGELPKIMISGSVRIAPSSVTDLIDRATYAQREISLPEDYWESAQ